MAPEQAAGDPATDLRADLYAFGVMAYEMLAGHVPFAGRSMQAILAAHATEVPRSIAALRPATPEPLADLVMRCLEKRPGDRPQSADQIVHALDAIGGTTSGASVAPGVAPSSASAASLGRGRAARIGGIVAGVAVCVLALALGWRTYAGTRSALGDEIRSIAVLPFENTSGDTTFDYLEDGITDHVRDALNAMPELTVKARSSSHRMKGRDAREIGATLGVAAVLRGTVSHSASRLHVTAELVRAADDIALWSSTFDRQASELAGIQDTITRAVTRRLHLRDADARPSGAAVNGARGTTDSDAYSDFLRGRYAFARFDFVRAVEALRSAVARDPRFARAHALLAMAYANTPTLGVASVDSMNALARASAERALTLDSTVVEAYLAESYLLTAEMRWADAVKPVEKALRMDSTNSEVLFTYASSLSFVGRIAEALAQARRARDRDPLSQTAVGFLAYVLQMSGQYDAALATARVARDLDASNVLMHQSLGFLFSFSGMPDSAVAAFETAFKLNPNVWGGRSNLVFGYAVAGRWSDAARQRPLLERDPPGNSPHYPRMVVDLAYGDYDAAMMALERGVAAREPLFGVLTLACDPLLDPLKSNPRFTALMQRLGARACPATTRWPIATHRG